MWFGAHLMQKKQKNTKKKFCSRWCMFSCDFFFFSGWARSSWVIWYQGETSGMIAAPFPWLMPQLRDDFTSTGYFGSICLPWETVGMCHPSLFVNGSASSLGRLRLGSCWFRRCLCAVFVWRCTLRLIKSEELQLLLISRNMCFFYMTVFKMAPNRLCS